VGKWLRDNWIALAVGALVTYALTTGAYEWLIGGALPWLTQSQADDDPTDVPGRDAAEEADPTDVVDRTAQEHSDAADLPDPSDAPTPEDLIRQQAEDLP